MPVDLTEFEVADTFGQLLHISDEIHPSIVRDVVDGNATVSALQL